MLADQPEADRHGTLEIGRGKSGLRHRVGEREPVFGEVTCRSFFGKRLPGAVQFRLHERKRRHRIAAIGSRHDQYPRSIHIIGVITKAAKLILARVGRKLPLPMIPARPRARPKCPWTRQNPWSGRDMRREGLRRVAQLCHRM